MKVSIFKQILADIPDDAEILVENMDGIEEPTTHLVTLSKLHFEDGGKVWCWDIDQDKYVTPEEVTQHDVFLIR